MTEVERSHRWLDRAIVCVILLVTVALRPPREIFLHHEEAAHAVAATMVLAGKVQARDICESGPPGTTLLYALVMAVFGRSMMAVHCAALAFILLTQIFVYKVVRRLFDRYAACSAAMCYGVFSTTQAAQHVLAAHSEFFMALPATLSIYWVLKSCQERKVRGFFLVGMFGAIAALFRWAGGLDAAGGCLFAVVLAIGSRVRAVDGSVQGSSRQGPGLRPAGGIPGSPGAAAALVAVGVAAVVAPVLLYFWRNEALPEAWRLWFGPGLAPAGAGAWREALSLVTDNWLFLSLALVGALTIVFRPPDRGPGADRRPLRPLLIYWTLSSLLGALGACVVRPFVVHHYIQLLAPLSALAGPAARAIAGNCLEAGWRRPKSLVLAAFLFVGTCLPVTRWHGLGGTTIRSWLDLRMTKGYLAHWHENEVEKKVAECIQGRTPAGAKIFVWGSDPAIYFYARREPASRFILCHFLASPTPGGRESDAAANWDRWRKDIQRNPPDLIVDARAPGVGYPLDKLVDAERGPIRELLDRGYQEVQVVLCDGNDRLLSDEEAAKLRLVGKEPGKVVIYMPKQESR